MDAPQMKNDPLQQAGLPARSAGVLLHISSLPGPFPSGDIGEGAHAFVNFLADCGFHLWQMLPVNPPQGGLSPYQSGSVHAGNPRFISLQPLIERGWLDRADFDALPRTLEGHKQGLRLAWKGFSRRASQEQRRGFEAFSESHAHWLDDYVLFEAMHEHSDGKGWWDWPEAVRARQPRALGEMHRQLDVLTQPIRFEQMLFFEQWAALKAHANSRGVRLFGDMPIFVAHDSAEVWSHQQAFFLDASGQPTVVAGVPPDYFSATGQRWGNPLYRWDVLAEQGFVLWKERLRTQLQLFDLIRIDHFRGFESYWEIPAQDDTAMNGHWVPAKGYELFDALRKSFGRLPLIAEDLGVITDAVLRLRLHFGLPGMKILQFAFSGGNDNPYLPFNQERNSVVYTGTHDNDTTLGWYLDLDDATRERLANFLGPTTEPMPWPMIRQALVSRAAIAVIPMQDLLGLDGTHRLNLPGTTKDNWVWRFDWTMVDPALSDRCRVLLNIYGRD